MNIANQKEILEQIKKKIEKQNGKSKYRALGFLQGARFMLDSAVANGYNQHGFDNHWGLSDEIENMIKNLTK